MSRRNFASDASKNLIVQIHQLIRSAGGATKNDIYLVTRLSERRISQYLTHMTEYMGVVHKLPQRVAGRDVWADGQAPKPEIVEFYDDDVDHAPRRVKILSSWIPNHVRDSLVAALFGAPTKGNDHAQE